MILIFVLFFVALVSFLYYKGYIPQTVRYARRVYNFNALDKVVKSTDLYKACDVIKSHESLREKYDGDDSTYFSFTGSKKVSDMIDGDKYKKYMDLRSTCKKIDSGAIIKKSEFVAILKSVGINNKVVKANCKNIIDALSGMKIERVIDGGKLYAPSEIITQLYPQFYSEAEKICPK